MYINCLTVLYFLLFLDFVLSHINEIVILDIPILILSKQNKVQDKFLCVSLQELAKFQ